MKRPAMPAGDAVMAGLPANSVSKGKGECRWVHQESIFEAADGASRIQKMTPLTRTSGGLILGTAKRAWKV
jgi:hypothetical protein